MIGKYILLFAVGTVEWFIFQHDCGNGVSYMSMRSSVRSFESRSGTIGKYYEHGSPYVHLNNFERRHSIFWALTIFQKRSMYDRRGCASVIFGQFFEYGLSNYPEIIQRSFLKIGATYSKMVVRASLYSSERITSQSLLSSIESTTCSILRETRTSSSLLSFTLMNDCNQNGATIWNVVSPCLRHRRWPSVQKEHRLHSLYRERNQKIWDVRDSIWVCENQCSFSTPGWCLKLTVTILEEYVVDGTLPWHFSHPF